MKFINNNCNNDNNINSSNWLGFSISPETNTNPTPSTMQDSAQIPHHLNYTNIYGSAEGENGNGVYTAFPIMPLKSDGSLCLMEAITRSQSQGMVATSAPPKLENFLSGVPMGTHEFDRQNGATMYYHRHEPHQIPPQNYQDYSSLRALYQTVQEQEVKGTQNLHHHQQQHHQNLASVGDQQDDDITGMKNWISRNYHSGVGNGESYGELQSLSLSMSFGGGSQSTACVDAVSSQQEMIPAGTVTECGVMDTKKRGSEKVDQHKQIVHRKSLDTFGQRTSQYRGVTRHRWTGRYEAHLWDNSCKKEGQSRKGRQVYLGGYDMEEKAARAYDLAALKYWGPATHINFPLENYEQEVVEMKNMSRQEYVAHLRRRSSGFSRGASVYRGVTRHHQHGRWQARIGRVAGNKDLYLGTFSTQEEAAEAYDVAAIKFRGVNAVTNFDISRYNVEKIIASNTLLAGDLARRTKEQNPTTTNEPSSDQQLVLVHEPKTILTEPATDINMLDWKITQYDQNHTGPSGFGGYEGDEGSKHGTHLSSSSSLVTSLSGSREHSPGEGNDNGPQSSASKILGSSSGNVWVPTAAKAVQMRSHIPVFAAWSDA